MPMRTLLASIFCLCAVTVFGQEFRKTDFATGSLTNVPATIAGGSTSNINCVLFTSPGKGIALFPVLSSTNPAATGDVYFEIAYAKDTTLTSWTTTGNTFITNALNGTNAVIGRHVLSASDLDPVAAVKVLYVRSTNDATNTATISGVGYSLRY